MSITDQERADRSAAAMWANDRATEWLGVELVSVGKGIAEMHMKVEPHRAQYLPRRVYLYACGYGLCLCLQQLQSSDCGAAQHDHFCERGKAR